MAHVNKESINTEAWTWQERAACRWASDEDHQLFTSPGAAGRGGHEGNARVRDLSARFCDHCPVKLECSNWAETDEGFIGIAAGKQFTLVYREEQQRGREAARINRSATVAERMYEEWKEA